jgi:hypothetical protein
MWVVSGSGVPVDPFSPSQGWINAANNRLVNAGQGIGYDASGRGTGRAWHTGSAPAAPLAGTRTDAGRDAGMAAWKGRSTRDSYQHPAISFRPAADSGRALWRGLILLQPPQRASLRSW